MILALGSRGAAQSQLRVRSTIYRFPGLGAPAEEPAGSTSSMSSSSGWTDFGSTRFVYAFGCLLLEFCGARD